MLRYAHRGMIGPSHRPRRRENHEGLVISVRKIRPRVTESIRVGIAESTLCRVPITGCCLTRSQQSPQWKRPH